MYNLIVSNRLEDKRRGLIDAGRVFEHTSDSVADQFMPAGVLDIPALLSLPTIIMEEGVSDEIAGIGYLTRIEVRGTDFQFHFALDPEIPLMSNAAVYELKSELGIDNWEFSRNHWAVKDIDLFQVLFRRNLYQRAAPTVFDLSEKPVNPKLVSMMMPFAGFDRVHQTVKSAVEAAGYECRRADDFWVHSHIMQDIVELICTSKVIICDLTGKNPNVFYEAGIAHSLGKEVILITQHRDDVPFDLQSLRYIHYLNNQEGCDRLAADIVARLATVA